MPTATADVKPLVLDYLKAGNVEVHGFNKARAECQRMIGELEEMG